MSQITSSKQDYESRNLRASIYSALWILGWATAWSVTAWLLKYKLQASEVSAILSILFNILIGIGMIVFYMRWISGMDELQRKNQVDALALSLGVAVVGGSVLSLMAVAGYLNAARASHVVILICVTYSAATLYGCVRYR